MKRFNASKVRALGNLQPLSEKQKRYGRKARGVKVRWSKDQDAPSVKKSREFLAPVKQGFIPAKPRGRSGCRLNDATRAAMAARMLAREAFFASLGAE